MGNTPMDRMLVASRLKGLDKDSHAKSLAAKIAGKLPKEELLARIEAANSVIAAMRESGVTSFYAAEHAKLFTDPLSAVRERNFLKTGFEVNHKLKPRQAAKMADCVLFAAAKSGDASKIGMFNTLADVALNVGVPFSVVADAVYYSTVSPTPADFAARLMATSLKQGKPMDISQVSLAKKLEAGLADSA